ncbi:uncharacterized protein DSM5745_05115 [Aspergillus mulundensis]|uniref:Uncharacterized protein n=1 Tax=Aspergillus mulundensis TaxID=1810919 RepID=A0A3D8S5K2_9EURO|nr:hypothetical protein DSM5745_05115 [Aspergillus mulundensis]RDW81558.1 hypothetical protein DSM5745_05115 [Aspergillus mulundensis]
MQLLSTLISIGLLFASPALSQDDPEPTPSTNGTIQAYAQEDWPSYPNATAVGCLNDTGYLDLNDAPACAILENAGGFISTADGDFLRILPDGQVISIEEPDDNEATRCTPYGANDDEIPADFLYCVTRIFSPDQEFESGPRWYPVDGSDANNTVQLAGNGTDDGPVLGLVFVPVNETAGGAVV